MVAAMVCGSVPRVVAPEWSVVSIEPALAELFSGSFSDALRHEGLDIVNAQDIITMFGLERRKQLLGCEEGESCVAELANALGCDATLLVTLARLPGGTFRGLAKLMGRNGKVMSSSALEGTDEQRLLNSFPDAAAKLILPLQLPVKRRKPSFSRWGWVPLAAGAATAGVGSALFLSSRSVFDTVLTAETRAEAQRISNEGAAQQTASTISLGAGAALMVTGLTLLLWPEADVRPRVEFLSRGSTVGVGLEGRF